MPRSSIIWFDKAGIGDVPAVGGKNASLGEMVVALSGVGVRVPTGFATTAAVYRAYVAANGLEAKLREWLASSSESGDDGDGQGRSLTGYRRCFVPRCA